MLRSSLVAAIIGGASMAQAATIASFNFNSVVNDATTGTGSLVASTGTGTAAATGGVTTSFNAGSNDDANTTDNSAVAFTSQPAQGTNNKTAGIVFTTSTAGYNAITLSFSLRGSGTASRYYQLQTSTDGVNFSDVTGGTGTNPTTAGANPITASVPTGTIDNNGFIDLHENAGSQVFIFPYSYTLATNDAASNNALFAFRIVTAFAPATSTYVASSDASTYGTGGNTRIDSVNITGTATPEPASLALVGIAGLVGLRRRGRRVGA